MNIGSFCVWRVAIRPKPILQSGVHVQGRPGEGEVCLRQCLAEARMRVYQVLHVVRAGLPTHHQCSLGYQLSDLIADDMNTYDRAVRTSDHSHQSRVAVPGSQHQGAGIAAQVEI